MSIQLDEKFPQLLHSEEKAIEETFQHEITANIVSLLYVQGGKCSNNITTLTEYMENKW